MLFRGLMVTSLSGSMDGVVASHNAGGSYFRNRTTPTDPATGRQVNCREALAACYAWWRDNMDDAARSSWETYALSHPVTNRIGNVIHLSPFDAFCRQAFMKFQINEQLGGGMDPGTSPPLYGIPFAQAPSAVLAGGNTIRVTWQSMEIWEGDQDNVIAVYVAAPRPHTINFFKGPYQLIGTIVGDSEDPPTSPVDIGLPWSYATGEKMFYRLRFVGNDRPLSQPWPGVSISDI